MSKHCWTKGAERLAQGRVATDMQSVKTQFLQSTMRSGVLVYIFLSLLIHSLQAQPCGVTRVSQGLGTYKSASPQPRATVTKVNSGDQYIFDERN